MSPLERLQTDYATLGHSTGGHPMNLLRRTWEVESQQVNSQKSQTTSDLRPSTCRPSTAPLRAIDLQALSHGTPITVAGLVICRQRPSTAKGHCFISLEDETGIANLFVPRDTFQRYRLTITTEAFLLCHGRLQITEGGQPTIFTTHIEALDFPAELRSRSHDFH